MRKFVPALGIILALGACDSHDPILPGERRAVFNTPKIEILKTSVENLTPSVSGGDVDCPYTQDADNVIWHGDKKIFTGFPTSTHVASDRHPVCHGSYVYAGLSTGEVVKLNPRTRAVSWVTDVFRPSNMTGGASMVDIIAPVVVDGTSIYAAGLGDAVCRLRTDSGNARWCAPIGSAYPIVVTQTAIFVMATDGSLYALRPSDGAAYWRTEISRPGAPVYDGTTITVGRVRVDAATGKIRD